MLINCAYLFYVCFGNAPEIRAEMQWPGRHGGVGGNGGREGNHGCRGAVTRNVGRDVAGYADEIVFSAFYDFAQQLIFLDGVR